MRVPMKLPFRALCTNLSTLSRLIVANSHWHVPRCLLDRYSSPVVQRTMSVKEEVSEEESNLAVLVSVYFFGFFTGLHALRIFYTYIICFLHLNLQICAS